MCETKTAGPQPGAYDPKRLPLVRYGLDLRDALATLVAERGWQRILPVVTGSLTAKPHVIAALASLGNAATPVFSRLAAHTPLETVLALSATIRESQPDALLAIGGGSAIDAAKIAALASGAGIIDRDALIGLRAQADPQGVQQPSSGRRGEIALVAAPTTLSGAEFGLIAGATDTQSGVKYLFREDSLAPDIVLYDPRLALETPLDLWLSTGIRAVDHAVETILSRDANPFATALALRALALLRDGLRASRSDPGDASARHQSQLGCWLASSTIGRVRYGASHGIGHQLGAAAGVPHGITSCVLLPAVLAYNAPVSAEAQTDIAAIFSEWGASAETGIRGFVRSLGLPVTIGQLKLPEDRLERIAETSLGNAFVRSNLRPIASADQVMRILRYAYAPPVDAAAEDLEPRS